jgi:SpoVK/Ycf46/Vps4 family AAA+-type ATPase
MALKSKAKSVGLKKTTSRYIGETEKNLGAVLPRAEKSEAVLLFDEADALLGKRTEVKDSHDRYANVETAANRLKATKQAIVTGRKVVKKKKDD